MKISFWHRKNNAHVAESNATNLPPTTRKYHWLLQLKCRGKLICSGITDELPELLKIGKAADNDWVISEDIPNCLPYHLELHLMHRELQVCAVAEEKFTVHGKPLNKYVAHRGDRITFGDCELLLQKPVVDEDICAMHRLEIQNGPRASEVITLDKPITTIGSAPDNDIVFDSDVVSQHHAEIRIASSGEAWIKDRQSLNGTFINSTRLSNQERMLMDSDEISIAFYDLLFWDRQKPHMRSQFSKKLLIMGGTILVIVLGFYLVYSMKSKAGELFVLADYYAKTEQFDKFDQVLHKLPEAPGFPDYEMMYQLYQNRLYHYRKTIAVWNDLKNNLQNSNFRGAIECFGRLDYQDRTKWDWNDSTVDKRMAFIRRVKQKLNNYFRLRSTLQDMQSSPETQLKLWRQVQQFKLPPPEAKQEHKWLEPLNQEIGNLLDELKNNCQIYEQAQVILTRLDGLDIKFSSLIQELEPLQKKCTGSIRLWICNIIDVLKDMDEDAQVIQKNQQALVNLRFAEIDHDVTFIPIEECRISPTLVAKRLFLESRQKKILLSLDILLFIRKHGIDWTKNPVDALKFAQMSSLTTALQFSCLNYPMPLPKSPRVAGGYDDMFGINYFYGIIRQTLSLTTNVYQLDTAWELHKIPQCLKVNRQLRQAREINLWLHKPENRWMLQGKILQLQKYCLQLKACQRELLTNLDQIVAQNRGNRTALVAQVAKFYFAPAGTIDAQELQSFAANWRKYQRNLQEILVDYDPMQTEKAQKIGREILKHGIPGEPLTNRVWSNLSR